MNIFAGDWEHHAWKREMKKQRLSQYDDIENPLLPEGEELDDQLELNQFQKEVKARTWSKDDLV